MDNVIQALREQLRADQVVRRPDEPGAGPRPWLPPAYKHPDDGAAPGPGDAAEAKRPATAHDDGTVLTIFHAPGMDAGAGERRIVGIDLHFRSLSVPAIYQLEGAIRSVLLDGPVYPPGGRCDWIMGGLYVIQAQESKLLQPLSGSAGVHTFVAGYLIEIRA